MKKTSFIAAAVAVFLAVVLVGQGYCQFEFKPKLFVANLKHNPDYGSGTMFLINLVALEPPGAAAVAGVKSITAINTSPGADGKIYNISLTPRSLNMITEWYNPPTEFTGQYGVYRVTVTNEAGTSFNLTDTDYLPPDLTPLPIPEKLKVDFDSGNTTPTLSFDPVPSDVSFNYYEFRIYDKDYTRRIYRKRLFPPVSYPSVTFPDRTPGGQTGEDLIPGETYLFRADIWKFMVPGSSSTAMFSSNFIRFKIPK